MEIALLCDDAHPQLWQAYKKTREFKGGQTKAIPPHHPLVEVQERNGLRSIYTTYVVKLSDVHNFRTALQERNITDWLNEWKHMHKLLWEHILNRCGAWRNKEVRFGDVGDEEIYHIPMPQDVPREMVELARVVQNRINLKHRSDEEKYITLAIIHYQFIRIHPFEDGNGRIARAITDQLAIFFGFPVAMGGYPRHDDKRRKAYHKAIRAAADDPSCKDLAGWISNYIEQQLDVIA